MEELIFKEKLFGKEIEVLIYGFERGLSKSETKRIMEEFYSEALRLQKIFNLYDEESELSKLNKMGKMKVSEDLLRVLKKSLKYYKITSGEYNPALGKDILLRKSGEDVNKDSIKGVKIVFKKVILPKNVELDLGSIAKGYLTDKLSDFLKSKGIKEFVINSRGDLVFSGKMQHVIGVTNPRDLDKDLLKIKVNNCGVATSGDYNQFYGTHEKSHILNKKDKISITVVSPKLEDADVLATALFVADEKTFKELIEINPKAMVLVIDNKLNKKMYNSFERLLDET